MTTSTHFYKHVNRAGRNSCIFPFKPFQQIPFDIIHKRWITEPSEKVQGKLRWRFFAHRSIRKFEDEFGDGTPQSHSLFLRFLKHLLARRGQVIEALSLAAPDCCRFSKLRREIVFLFQPLEHGLKGSDTHRSF